jgi:thiamine-monophosphate kinase
MEAEILADVGEDALVARLVEITRSTDARLLVGPGDDCAVVQPPFQMAQLMKTDVVVENVHFLSSHDPKLIGRKALARVLSDIAAMGGSPDFALVTLVLRPDLTLKWVEDVYHGLNALAAEYGVVVVGGETTRGSQVVISVSLTGSLPHGMALRSGGKPGDRLFVTGRLGGSYPSGKHLTFSPRLQEACWLMKNHPPTAMMDLSDGLGMDLPRLAAASATGWKVQEDCLPLHEGSTVAAAWGDGEDYELLFAVSPSHESALLEDWTCAFPSIALTAIGWLTEDLEANSQHGGWDSFRTGGHGS